MQAIVRARGPFHEKSSECLQNDPLRITTPLVQELHMQSTCKFIIIASLTVSSQIPISAQHDFAIATKFEHLYRGYT